MTFNLIQNRDIKNIVKYLYYKYNIRSGILLD